MNFFASFTAAAAIGGTLVAAAPAPAKANDGADIAIGIIGSIMAQKQFNKCVKEYRRDGVPGYYARQICSGNGGGAGPVIIMPDRPRHHHHHHHRRHRGYGY